MSQKGFTLIELLMVIAIISIIAAAAFPRIINARNRANEESARLYARGVSLWAVSWLTDSDDSHTIDNLPSSCTDSGYVFEGAPAQLHKSVLSCAVETDALSDFLIRITVVTGTEIVLRL